MNCNRKNNIGNAHYNVYMYMYMYMVLFRFAMNMLMVWYIFEVCLLTCHCLRGTDGLV